MAHEGEISTLYELFITRYLNKLSVHSTASSVQCGIYIGNILGTFTNCVVKITNRCNNNTETSFRLLEEAFIETVSLIPEPQRTELADSVGITLIPTATDSNLLRYCKASATLSQSIDIQTLNLGTCEAPPGRSLVIQLVNSGSAVSNCGLERIYNVFSKENTFIPIYPNIHVKDDTLLKITSVAIFIFILLIMLYGIRRNIRLKYQYGRYIVI